MSDRIATHEQPPDADLLVHADLEPHGMAGAREQLWVKQVDERRFASLEAAQKRRFQVIGVEDCSN